MREKNQNEWPLWRLILIGLNLIALVLSVILSWHYLKGGAMPGCDGASACEQVLSSKWSLIAGKIPVSGLAMGVYLAMLIATSYTSPATDAPTRRLVWSVLLIMAGSITGMAIWFIIVQKWIIGEFCPYCMTEHAIGLLMAVIIIWRSVSEFEDLSNLVQTPRLSIVNHDAPAFPRQTSHPVQIMGFIACGLVIAGLLAVSQATFMPKTAYSEGSAVNNLPDITYKNVPIIGSPDAPYIVKMLFDYNCPHCQKLHLMLNTAVNRYHGKLAFALCPTPLNTQCNPYIPRDVDAFKNSCELAKIGLAVWVAKREALTAFDNWMFSFESGQRWEPRTPEAARAKAMELVGQSEFNKAQASTWIDQYIATCVQIYGQTIQTGKGGVPKLIFGSHWVIPEPSDADELITILQKSLALPKPDALK